MFVDLWLLLCVTTTFALFEGDFCSSNGAPGICRNIFRCQSAREDLQKRINPQLCAFNGSTPIVCCINKGGTLASTTSPNTMTPPPRPVATTPQPSRPTTEHIPPVNDYHSVDSESCRPILPDLTSKKTGQKSLDKCIEYQEKLIFPCAKSVALSGERSRVNKCKRNAHELILFGVENAGFAEYSHMALLGFGPPDSTQWLCAGSLISDRFILTAAQCTATKDLGAVTFALLGTLRRSDPLSNGQLYGISRILKPDAYKPPSKYNDIALLQTDKQVHLNEFIVPACLHIGNSVADDRASATGWGFTQTRESVVDSMQKVSLFKFTTEDCSESYKPSRMLKNGFDPKTQICYGDKEFSNICQGDSGGPLQITNKQVYCMWTIIGVSSLGNKCGIAGTPGIYTKVSEFLPWIESIVWA